MSRASMILSALLFLPYTSPAQPGGPDSKDGTPKGVHGFHGTIKAIHKDSVEVAGEFDKAVMLKVTKDTTLDEADTPIVDGAAALRTKRITLADLHRDQPISVIFFSDGKELVLLRAVASGPKLSGMEVGSDVRKLGGKLERLLWVKDHVALSVDLSGTGVSDTDLTVLSQSRAIEVLNLSFTRVTDKGLARLTGFRDLRDLRLAGTKITDEGIESLRRIRSLNTIDLSQTGVTDDGFAQLVEGRTLNLCRASLGDKAHYRVLQEFKQGKLEYNYLMIGDTYFGRYYTGVAATGPTTPPQDRRREATTYYHRHGPVGSVMSNLEWFKPAGLLDYRSDSRLPATYFGLLAPSTPLPVNVLPALWSEPSIAVVRLNVGTHVAYGRPFQHIHFYDNSPEVRSFSISAKGQPVYFGYIQDALKRGCCVQVLEGPERASLTKKSPKAFYQAMFVEITRDDLRDINTDLLTKEAVADMVQCLTETGVLCFHTSHRYHDFVRPIVAAAGSLGLSWKVGHDVGGGRSTSPASSHFGSEWVVIARQPGPLKGLTDSKVDDFHLEWETPPATAKNLWRDGQPHNLKAIARPPVTP